MPLRLSALQLLSRRFDPNREPLTSVNRVACRRRPGNSEQHAACLGIDLASRKRRVCRLGSQFFTSSSDSAAFLANRSELFRLRDEPAAGGQPSFEAAREVWPGRGHPNPPFNKNRSFAVLLLPKRRQAVRVHRRNAPTAFRRHRAGLQRFSTGCPDRTDVLPPQFACRHGPRARSADCADHACSRPQSRAEQHPLGLVEDRALAFPSLRALRQQVPYCSHARGLMELVLARLVRLF